MSSRGKAAQHLLGLYKGNAGANQQGENVPHWLPRQLPDALDVPIRRSPGR
jgi:hypothetical protein